MSHSQTLRERQQNAVVAGVATKSIFVEKAQNAELWAVDGRRFIDFAAGIAVTNTGHRHPHVMSAVAEQAELFTHTCFHGKRCFDPTFRISVRSSMLWPNEAPTYDDYRVYA
ncbi:MAG TPA: aminotransferase class III-fold pyridoxal phosphate-dependent enzyme [Ensifer sp.]|nr:aminotransferase class III-fold pyridoxal phosphate-dependent enzyme [Ensifer sp.]